MDLENKKEQNKYIVMMLDKLVNQEYQINDDNI